MTISINRTIDTITISAEPDAIFRMAADIERWPDIFPHYRWVKVLEQRDDERVVEMAAKRGWIPVKWTALQVLDAGRRRVYYRHIGGATRGMEVEWSFQPESSEVTVKIVHEMSLLVPFVRMAIGKRIVGNFFVKHIAGQTLNCIKQLLEAERKIKCGGL